MGLFDWFQKKPAAKRLDDRIWLTVQARENGLVQEAGERLAEGAVVLLVAHFPATLRSLADELQQAGNDIALESEATPQAVRRWTADQAARTSLHVTLAESLCAGDEAESSASRSQAEPGNEAAPVAVLVAERHPLRARDESVERFAALLGERCSVRFHSSLEDPLLKTLAGEWVGDMLRQLGLSESEAVESRMVSRRLQAAQKKIAARAFGDAQAESAEEWFERNCPS